MKHFDAIFTADNHFRLTKPVAWKEGYLEEQWGSLLFIEALAEQYGVDIYCAGDFFDKWSVPPELLSQLIKRMHRRWHVIYGDHDIPSKNLKFVNKSALYTLWTAGKVNIVTGGNGVDKNDHKLPKHQQCSAIIGGRKVLLWHVLTWKNELPYPGCENKSAKQLLKRYPQFDCIVTGDNHKPFVQKYQGRILVNCGSMMRISADQIDYKPAVWLYDAKKNDVEPCYLPIAKNVISREHIDTKNKINERIEAFVSSLDKDIDIEMSFEKNLELFMKKNKTKKGVKNIINKYV